MSRLANAAVALREVAEMYRGFLVIEEALAELGGLARAGAALERQAEEARAATAAAEQQADEARAAREVLVRSYHEVVRAMKKDPRLAVQRLL